MKNKNVYHQYIGSHENMMGRTAYIKTKSGYIGGKVVGYVFPKHGIIGTYKIHTEGRTRSATTIYTKEEEMS